MSVSFGPSSLLRCMPGAAFLRLIEAPGRWLTGFIDGAEEIWSSDPLLSDDEELQLTAGPF